MNPEQIKYRIATSIHEKDPNAEAILYGSRAKGDYRPDSDWDILILVDDPKFTNELDDKYRIELYNLSLEIEQAISINIYPKIFWNSKLRFSPLYYNVLKEGIRL
jgi:predicted nucleotidyltransferase